MGNSILKYDVIHDEHTVILDKKFDRPRSFGDRGTGRILAKNREKA
jgi:hypothetical protein